jgi:hypothetical protein
VVNSWFHLILNRLEVIKVFRIARDGGHTILPSRWRCIVTVSSSSSFDSLTLMFYSYFIFSFHLSVFVQKFYRSIYAAARFCWVLPSGEVFSENSPLRYVVSSPEVSSSVMQTLLRRTFGQTMRCTSPDLYWNITENLQAGNPYSCPNIFQLYVGVLTIHFVWWYDDQTQRGKSLTKTALIGDKHVELISRLWHACSTSKIFEKN